MPQTNRALLLFLFLLCLVRGSSEGLLGASKAGTAVMRVDGKNVRMLTDDPFEDGARV
jgi:hypothetical protein